MPELPKLPTPEEVNYYHLAADKDAGPGALHHTLGLGSSQASPGNHDHDGRNSKRIKLENLHGVSVSYQPQGGTIGGTQPTFSGDPLITGSYTKIGNLVFFQIDVDFSNITDFGTGQYYLTLPFAAEHDSTFRAGFLKDASTGRKYAISGHAEPGSNIMALFGLASNGLDEDFTHNTPTALATADSFHVSGTYEINP